MIKRRERDRHTLGESGREVVEGEDPSPTNKEGTNPVELPSSPNHQSFLLDKPFRK
jgi:hypothetical protein